MPDGLQRQNTPNNDDDLRSHVVTKIVQMRERFMIKVTSFEVRKGGWFGSDYCMYVIESSCKVERKDQDFYTFRKQIRQSLPHLLCPPLPSLKHKMTEKALNKRRQQL